MEQIVTIASISTPQPGKKQGAVYDTAGNRWGVWADKLQNYNVGSTYKLMKITENNFQGKTYKTVGECELVGGAVMKTNGSVSTVKAPPTTSGDFDVIRRRDIWICGLMNNLFGNTAYLSEGIIPKEEDLIRTVNSLKRVWEATLGPNARNADLNDELPDFAK
jgi:hypothetical protein